MSYKKNHVTLLGYDFYRFTFALALLFVCYIHVWFILAATICYVVGNVFIRIRETVLTERIQGQGQRCVFITGCDSGFGFMFAQRLEVLGFIVFAGCLNHNSHGAIHLRTKSSKRVHVIQLDVTKETDVAAALAYVKKHLPRKGLWGIVNNAGVDVMGEVELTPVFMYEKGFKSTSLAQSELSDMLCLSYASLKVHESPACMLRANLWMDELGFKAMRHKIGRIVIVSSIHALMSVPGQAVYEASKHALETIADSLRLEMIKFNVKVSLVEPGAFDFATSIASKHALQRQKQELEEMWNVASEEVRQIYNHKQLLSRVPKPQESWPPDSTGGHGVIAAVENALCTQNARTRYFVWGDRSATVWHIAAALYSITPTWMMDKYITWCDTL